jgi:hypothetical protein
MRRLSVALLGGLFAIYASTATAVDFPNGLYWGFNAGIAEEEKFCEDVGKKFMPSLPAQGFDEITGCDDTDLGYQIYAGYQFMKWLSVEGGYTNLGGSDILLVQDEVKTDVDGWSLGLALTAPYIEKIGLYALVGAYRWDKERTQQRSGEPLTKDSDSGTNQYWGLALRYPLTEKIGINLEVKNFLDIGDDKVGETDYGLYTAGLSFRF